MAVAKYKLERVVGSGDWYSWDGDMLHLPRGPLAAGVGATITTVVGTTPTSHSATAFDNLVTEILANQVDHAANFSDAVVGNTGATSSVAALVAAVT